jgi:DNA polymerase I-like protein with 3'-5' exonuclease and polymerase domains
LADEKLTMRAAVNPVFAMEEIGYEFSDELRASIERRARFRPGVYKRMETLVGDIQKIANRPINPDSAADLDRLLFDEYKLVRPRTTLREQLAPAYHSLLATSYATEPLPPQVGQAPAVKDPLEELRDAHPIMKPLLEYRHLDASAPRCATRELYEQVRSGSIKLPITKLTVVIQPHPAGRHD